MRNTLLALALVGCTSIPDSTEGLLNSRHASLVTAQAGIGSGWPITDDAFLTAWHVVASSDAEDITVGGWAVSEVIRLRWLDAAILVTGLHGLEPWPLAERGPRPGERVWKSGYGQGFHWWTEGIGTEDESRVSLDIFPGDSGAPVFNAKGEVLGIIVSVGVVGVGLILPIWQDHILHHCWIVPMSRIAPLVPWERLGLAAP